MAANKTREPSRAPGMIAYHELWDPILGADDAEVGALFRAAMTYHATGEEPGFTGMTELIWSFIRPSLDRNMDKYDETCRKKRYAVYCRDHKEDQLSYEDWARTEDPMRPAELTPSDRPDVTGHHMIPDDIKQKSKQ